MLKQHTSDQSWCPPGPVLKVQCPGETATTVTISTVARTRTTRRAMDPELDLSMKDIRYVKGFYRVSRRKYCPLKYQTSCFSKIPFRKLFLEFSLLPCILLLQCYHRILPHILILPSYYCHHRLKSD